MTTLLVNGAVAEVVTRRLTDRFTSEMTPWVVSLCGVLII